jgi:hypothetical protein
MAGLTLCRLLVEAEGEHNGPTGIPGLEVARLSGLWRGLARRVLAVRWMRRLWSGAGKGLASMVFCALLERSAGAAPGCDDAQRFTLKNGLEAIVVPDRRVPTVALVSAVHAGARDDPAGYAGLSHYVEHLTYRGTESFPSAFALYAEIGATSVNATTSADTTSYFAVLPAAQLERGIWIEARRLAIGLDSIDEHGAAEEQRVLLREHELRFGFRPGLALLTKLYAALYPAPHPYHSLFASEHSLEQLRLQDARWFFARHYRPDRTRVVLVGDLDACAARTSIERHFGAIAPAAPGAAALEPSALEPAALGCGWAKRSLTPSLSRITLRSRSKNERLELYWPLAPDEDPNDLQGVFNLLRGELSEAARQSGLSHLVSGGLVQRELASFWYLAIDVAPGAPLDRIEPLLSLVIDRTRFAFADDSELGPQREALELAARAAQTRFLARARGLARPVCTRAAGLDMAPGLTRAAVTRMDRFAVHKALIVERRFARGAALDGALEVVPWAARGPIGSGQRR